VLCSLESAFLKLPPSAHFYLFADPPFSDALRRTAVTQSVSDLLEPLYRQDRLHVIEIERYMESLVCSAPEGGSLMVHKACDWYQSGVWRKGYALNNKSNFLRLLLLYLHGGLYLDTDLFVLRNLFELQQGREHSGLVGLQGPGSLNNAVLSFSPENPFVLLALQAFFKEFNGEVWGHNGPDRLTGTWAMCLRQPPSCEPWLSIYPQETFYSVSYKDVSVLFEMPGLDFDRMFSKLCPRAYTVHLWNHFSKDMSLVPDTFMWGLASRYCPWTFDRVISSPSPSSI
jgi:hypothetical protein